ncbi:MAG: ribosome maturation factor RimM [Prevotellaceae bacterium]|jgi:16S rRNA processing protein RimM|nr:ribosome maturation factor RimM [Prevotellaceae bacterium]
MIKQEDLYPIGQIGKPHGVKGELAFSFNTAVFDREGCRFFVLEMERIFVPFFIEKYRLSTRNAGFVKFEDIDTEEEARDLQGKPIYVNKRLIEEETDEDVADIRYFIGFNVIADSRSIGKITAVNDDTANILFELNNDLLIPFSEEYITEIDHKKREILMNIPEGLLEL